MANKKYFNVENAKQLHPLIDKFLVSFANQTENSNWLENTLQDEHPEKSSEDIQKLAKGIRDSIVLWDENMTSLNQACDEGLSKEDWLADKLQEASVGNNIAEYGSDLVKFGKALHTANQSAMAEIEGSTTVEPSYSDTTSAQDLSVDEDEWNTYQARAVANQIGKEVEVSNLAGMVLREGWKLVDALPEKEGFQEIKQVADALRNGEDKGVKEAATAALQTGIERGYVPLLPKDTPISVVSSVACYGVEQAKIMLQYAEGDISGRKALELSGRTAIAAVTHPLTKKFEAIGTRLGQKAGMAVGTMIGTFLPILAPVATTVGSFIGGMVGKVAGSSIGKAIRNGAEKIIEVAKPVLKTTWESIKSVGKNIINGVKNFFESIFG